MGFIEDQSRKLAEEKQLVGRGMEYLDTKRAMDIERAREAQRALNMRPADGGLANRYAQEIGYNPGMNEEAKYAAMVDAQMREKAANDEMLRQAIAQKAISDQYTRDINTKFNDPGYWEAAQRAADVERGIDQGLAAKFRMVDTYGR